MMVAHEDDRAVLLAGSWTECALAIVLVLLRIYTRYSVVEESSKWPLTWTLAAMTFGIANAVFITVSVNYGMGLHISTLSEYQVERALLFSWLANAMSRLSICAGKTAVVAFVLELQRYTTKKWQRAFLWFIASSNIGLNISLACLMLLKCDPFDRLWNIYGPGECHLRQQSHFLGMFTVAWGCASDVALAIYPAFLFWGLQMKKRVKVGVSLLMGLGIVAAVCAAMTCAELQSLLRVRDPTYEQTPLTLWTTTEMWMVIIAASIPALWPMMRASVNRVRSRLSQSSARSLEIEQDKERAAAAFDRRESRTHRISTSTLGDTEKSRETVCDEEDSPTEVTAAMVHDPEAWPERRPYINSMIIKTRPFELSENWVDDAFRDRNP